MIKVIDNRVIWIAPFYFDDKRIKDIEGYFASDRSIWRDAEIKTENDVFYNHIQMELQASANSKLRTKFLEHSKNYQYRYYSLKQSQSLPKNAPQELLGKIKAWEYFKGKDLELPQIGACFNIEVADPSMKTVPQPGMEKVEPCENMYYPHIILWKEANVGLLVFSTKLGGKGAVDIKDLMNFNYAFHKTHKQKAKFSVIPRNVKDDIRNDKIPKMPCTDYVMRHVAHLEGFAPEASAVNEALHLFSKKDKQEDKEAKTAQINNIIKEINRKREDIYNKQRENTKKKIEKPLISYNEAITSEEIKPLECDSTMIVEFLFDGLYRYDADDENNIITMASKSSLKLFTYYHILSDSYSSERQNCHDMKQDFLRIGKCMNEKYQVSVEKEEKGNAILETFANIFVCAYAEGVAMLTVNPNKIEDYQTISKTEITPKKGMVRNFFDDFCNDNFEKRYLWIELWIELQRQAQLYGIKLITERNMSDNGLEALSKIVERIQAMKADTYFSDISSHTQHNEFYLFCRNSLCIDARFEEIDKKLQPLYGSIAKKRKEISDEEQHNKDVEANEKMVWLTIIIAILTFPSVVCDGQAVFVRDLNWCGQITWLCLCVIFYVGIAVTCYNMFPGVVKKMMSNLWNRIKNN